MIQLPDSLVTAYENLLRVIPKPLTTEEETERVRTCRECPDVDPTALHDGARRFVDALSIDPAAAVELTRRGTLCAILTEKGSEYSVAKTNAQKALSGWNPATQFGEHPVYLDFLQKTVRNLLQADGEELVAGVRSKHGRINDLLAVKKVPDATRTLLEAWRDAAWSIISKGENESLDGCYWLLHAEKLQYALFVPVAAAEVRQAADALVRWLKGGGDGASPVQLEDHPERWRQKARDWWKWAKSKWWLAVIIAAGWVFWKIIVFVLSIFNFIPDK